MSNLERKIHEIKACIERVVQITNFENSEQLFNGLSGCVLFLNLYNKQFPNPKTPELILNIIQKTTESIENNENLHLNYCAGLAGYCWLIAFMKKSKDVNLVDYQIDDEINDLLFESMKRDLEKKNYDYMHGAMGYGLYFLESGQYDKIEYLVKELDNISVKKDNTQFWQYYDLDTSEILDGVNLGMSHGQPSIVSFLTLVYNCKKDIPGLYEMIVNGTNYLLNNMQSTEDHGCYFGYSVLSYEKEVNWSRLAWCYGDLGICACLHNVSLITNDKNIHDAAIEMAKYSAKRLSLEVNSVDDAGLCHGSSGIAYLFLKLFKETNIAELEKASKYWIDKTLEFATFNNELANYKAFDSKHNVYYDSLGLLEGIGGIGLALLNFHNPKSSNEWDRILMLS